MGRRGRPPGILKLSDEIERQIILAIRAGNYIETAAAYAGIHKDTFYAWLKTAVAAKAKCPARRTDTDRRLIAFSDAIGKALAESEVRDVRKISEAIEGGDWRAAAWRLERKFTKRWGQLGSLVDEAPRGPLVIITPSRRQSDADETPATVSADDA